MELRETIPKKPDWNPIYRLPLSRDMIHKTKVKVLSIPTKEPVPKFVDTRHGDTMMLNPKSGLANDFVLKKVSAHYIHLLFLLSGAVAP